MDKERIRVCRELVCENLKLNGRAWLRLAGTSMLPNVWPGDVLEISRRCDINLGDIVFFVRDERFFCHRVVDISERNGTTELITRGDALHQCDPPIRLSDVLGVVTAIRRHGRAVSLDLKASPLAMRLIGHAVRPHSPLRRVVLKLHSMRARKYA